MQRLDGDRARQQRVVARRTPCPGRLCRAGASVHSGRCGRQRGHASASVAVVGRPACRCRPPRHRRSASTTARRRSWRRCRRGGRSRHGLSHVGACSLSAGRRRHGSNTARAGFQRANALFPARAAACESLHARPRRVPATRRSTARAQALARPPRSCGHRAGERQAQVALARRARPKSRPGVSATWARRIRSKQKSQLLARVRASIGLGVERAVGHHRHRQAERFERRHDEVAPARGTRRGGARIRPATRARSRPAPRAARPSRRRCRGSAPASRPPARALGGTTSQPRRQPVMLKYLEKLLIDDDVVAVQRQRAVAEALVVAQAEVDLVDDA